MAKERILVVDDEEDILELVRYNLAREGYTLVLAASGEDALKKAKREAFDLVVLDLMLPGLDGLEVAKALKSDPKTKPLPIIMLTAKGEDADVVSGLEIGADDYVTKPFSPRVLTARVKAILRRKTREPLGENEVVAIHDLEIHPGRRSVFADGQPVDLTYTEFRTAARAGAAAGLGVYALPDRGCGARQRLPGDRPQRGRAGGGAPQKAGFPRQLHRNRPGGRLPLQGKSMTKRRKLVWRLFISYLLITLGALGAAGWYTIGSLKHFLLDHVAAELADRARLLEYQIGPYLDPPDAGAIDAICKHAGKISGTRFTVILASGAVIGDTLETPQNMDNHSGRPEIAGALADGTGQSVRYSSTFQQTIIYVAVAVHRDHPPAVLVRASIPAARMEEQLARIRIDILLIGAAIAVLALAVTLAISRQYGRRLNDLKQGAARFAEGELAHRLSVPDSEELAGLAESLNRMAEQLEGRMQTVLRQRNQLEAVLSSMLEGVIAVDRDERIISVNQAAGRWLEVAPKKLPGRSIQETIRNLAMHQFVARALESRLPVEDDIVVFRKDERILNIKSAPLLDARQEPIGILIVFNDVTQMRRLENMRRDFVANVSHEIKTPLTAIKGFVETLNQGIVENPAEAQRFLGIVAKHVDRLDSVIEDLLMLSRIENEGERGDIKREKTRLWDIFQNAVQICRPRADDKRIQTELAGDDTVSAVVDPVLLEQAVVNLLDNAIKYSEPDKTVRISANLSGNEVQISVQDHGIGIEKKHLPRLFERFYRVDKARSRTLGGTGLGLAIVKHIAQAHGGHVTVVSTVGEGSTFTIHLPPDSDPS